MNPAVAWLPLAAPEARYLSFMDRTMELQLDVLRRLSEAERLQIMGEMCDAMRTLAAAGIRDRHPEWSDAEALRELRRIYGALPPESLPA